jgi:hypothetical protein
MHSKNLLGVGWRVFHGVSKGTIGVLGWLINFLIASRESGQIRSIRADR